MILWQKAFPLCFFMLKVIQTSYWIYNFLSAQLVFYFKKGKTIALIFYPTEEHIQSFFCYSWGREDLFHLQPTLSLLEYWRSSHFRIHWFTHSLVQPFLIMWFFCDDYNKILGSMYLQLLSVCIDISSMEHSHILFSSAHHLKTDFSYLLSSAVVGTPPGISCHQLAEFWRYIVCDPSISAYPRCCCSIRHDFSRQSIELQWPTNAQCHLNHVDNLYEIA